jgi:hypothetical protein
MLMHEVTPRLVAMALNIANKVCTMNFIVSFFMIFDFCFMELKEL